MDGVGGKKLDIATFGPVLLTLRWGFIIMSFSCIFMHLTGTQRTTAHFKKPIDTAFFTLLLIFIHLIRVNGCIKMRLRMGFKVKPHLSVGSGVGVLVGWIFGILDCG